MSTMTAAANLVQDACDVLESGEVLESAESHDISVQPKPHITEESYSDALDHVIEETDLAKTMYYQTVVCGESDRVVAKRHGMKRHDVCNAIRRIETKIAKVYTAKIDSLRARAHQRLDRIYCLAMRAYDTSKTIPQCTETRTEYTNGKTQLKTTESIVPQPAYLKVALQAIEAQRALLGLDAPTKIDACVSGNVQNINVQVSSASVEELSQLVAAKRLIDSYE